MGATDEEMSDTEMWTALKHESQERRHRNKASSTRLLRERGIPFESKNNGVHLIIRRETRVFDFWPSTGKWVERNNHLAPGTLSTHRPSLKQGRGIFNLLKELA